MRLHKFTAVILRTALATLLLPCFPAWAEPHSDHAYILTSGATGTLGVSGNTGTFEELISGSPATVSITIYGCMTGNTCDSLETNTSTTATQNRTPTISHIYDYFKVTATWTGGTNVQIRINATCAVASSSGGGTWGSITGTLSDQADLSSALALKAPLASPTFTGTVTIPSGASIAGFAPLASPALTGTPTVPTAAVDANTTQAASTAFVVGQAGSATPLIDGSAAVGTSTRYARADHVHPTDTTRAALASPALTGTPTVPTAAVDTNTTQAASTAFVLAQSASATPLIDGTATVGTSTRYARADHIHPTDTTRAPLASPTFTGTVTIPAGASISGFTKTIASGAKALATGAISSAACTSAQTDTATGTLTTDAISASFNGDPTAVTGYVPLTTGMLTIIVYPTADTVNFKVCNNTSASITPGAITLNWRVVR